MRRIGMYESDPDGDEGFLGRLKAAVSQLTSRLGGGRGQQALPMSQHRGVGGSVVPYQERRQQLVRARRQHSSYALIFVVVLLVLVAGIFYGLTWAMGSLGSGASTARATATVQPNPTADGAQAQAAGTPVVVVLPTAGPGGSVPSPAPSPGAGGPAAAGASPVATPGGQRTYTVKAGDSPNAIARQFGVTAEALMRANNVTDPTRLRVGQELVVPAPSPVTTPVSR
jgi:nucleoid-associated protein YgaU